ncbi:hypothetical protein [Pedobacter sp. Leaf194]|uniref:hypothetical protein n=1 Tax=Pedobacter sp. Leaf194 TaxID=1736297 RepID=UPI0007024B74|nr:hypothetical protein [Pedobacter sp. Leaf194]KQS32458.1 hypothetical protein ASG14_16365 [Pedobacter sp. Leaf194]
MKVKEGFGRLVDKTVHDQKYREVHTTLETVCAAKIFDKIVIFGRAGRQNVKGKKNGLIMITEDSDEAMAAYLTERDKEWSDNDGRYFNNDILFLIRQMVARKASHQDIQEVLDVFRAGLPEPTDPPLN